MELGVDARVPRRRVVRKLFHRKLGTDVVEERPVADSGDAGEVAVEGGAVGALGEGGGG